MLIQTKFNQELPAKRALDILYSNSLKKLVRINKKPSARYAKGKLEKNVIAELFLAD